MCWKIYIKFTSSVLHIRKRVSSVATFVSVQVFAEKMGLETGWNCHVSLTPNGDSPCDGAPNSPGHGSLHEDLNQGTKQTQVEGENNLAPSMWMSNQ